VLYDIIQSLTTASRHPDKNNKNKLNKLLHFNLQNEINKFNLCHRDTSNGACGHERELEQDSSAYITRNTSNALQRSVCSADGGEGTQFKWKCIFRL